MCRWDNPFICFRLNLRYVFIFLVWYTFIHWVVFATWWQCSQENRHKQYHKDCVCEYKHQVLWSSGLVPPWKSHLVLMCIFLVINMHIYLFKPNIAPLCQQRFFVLTIINCKSHETMYFLVLKVLYTNSTFICYYCCAFILSIKSSFSIAAVI